MDIIDVALALIISKLFGELAVRLKQMAVLGELFTGILFALIMTYFHGISFPLFGHTFSYNVHLTGESFELFANLGIILLLFIAGMETDIKDLKQSGKRGLSTASLGVTLPFLFGAIFALKVMHFQMKQSLVVGAIFTATSVGVTVRALMDLKQLRSKAGTTIITAAVIDDIIGILVLTFVLGTQTISNLIIGFIFFMFIIFVLALGPVQAYMRFAHEKMHSPYAVAAMAIGFGLLIAAFAREVGLAPITGAYFAGILIGMTPEKKVLDKPLNYIARSIFVPMFFVKVGTLFDFKMLTQVDFKFFWLIPIAFAGKFLGCGTGSLISGLKPKDAVRVGVGMMPEMEVALVIVTFAYGQGIFPKIIGSQLVSVTITYVVLSAILVPVLLRLLFPPIESAREIVKNEQ
ncbi:MAG: cation:proton antiporter [Caldisericaceae bacterium]|nr:cation:proton antiporter [Caldisericaceae bacterium]